ncbi:MAG: RAMP superfamily CRISPR-associated protein [Lachnospiraceae bacterium]|nr:RAMP superfamily CRISPR-associated protein [Lachnospiraceae bacterium]
MSNPVKKKIVFSIQVELDSPLCIASGKAGLTDADVILDYDGNPFVPASSLAGAMRAYLQKDKNSRCLFGYSEGEEGKMSALFLSDMEFRPGWEIRVRDGVALDEKKNAVDGSKYDMQMIEAGAKAHFYAELTIRKKNGTKKELHDSEEDYVNEVASILNGINSGKIRFGRKKTRGFGKMKLIQVNKAEFTAKNYLEYAKVYSDKDIWNENVWKKRHEEGWCVWEEWLKQKEGPTAYLYLQVPLSLQGGISIRQYASKKGEPDFVQLVRRNNITDNENVTESAVIPGSSMAGALKHRLKRILQQLAANGLKIHVQEILDTMFGYADDDVSHISMITVHESVIKGAVPLTVTRTGISRFESSARKRSLFTEKTYVGGTLNLEILIQKGIYEDHQWMLGFLLLAIRDLQNGYLAVGGETAIGRGIFQKNGEILLDGQPLHVDSVIAETLSVLAQKEGES